MAEERAEILRRRAAITQGLARLPGWRLRGCGAYFAYVEHPFEAPSEGVARHLLETCSILVLPGTMFGPGRSAGGDGTAERTLRVAFANEGVDGIAELIDRLAGAAAPALVPSASSA